MVNPALAKAIADGLYDSELVGLAGTLAGTLAGEVEAGLDGLPDRGCGPSVAGRLAGVQRATVYCTRSAEDTTSTPIPLTNSMVPASTLETTGRLEPAEYSIAMLLAPCSRAESWARYCSASRYETTSPGKSRNWPASMAETSSRTSPWAGMRRSTRRVV